MPRTQQPGQEPIVIQLAAALRQYAEDAARLAREWRQEPDMKQYARVSRQADEIRNLCASDPEFAVPWVTLLVSHAELMHALWRASYASQPAAADDVEQHVRGHAHCIAALLARCHSLLAEDARRTAR